MTNSKIPKNKNELWELLTHYFDIYNKNNFILLEDDQGKIFLKKLAENPKISKYQWKIKGSKENNILKLYIMNFILYMISVKINGSKKYNKKGYFSKHFKNNLKLKEIFDKKFKELEEKILISREFEYKLLIPTFRISFPKEKNIIKFDELHVLRNIYNEVDPYQIKNFKKPPRYWIPFEQRNYIKPEANACFEISVNIPKKTWEDSPYNYDFIPYFPFNPQRDDFFVYKTFSLYDFFLLHIPHLDFPPITFGHKIYIILPPFSNLNYFYQEGFIGYQFHNPIGYLSLKTESRLNAWKKCWKENYTKFYETYHKEVDINGPLRVFHYALDTIRMKFNIPRTDIKIFLLVSTFEGLLYRESIANKLGLGTKRKPIARIFIDLSNNHKKKWVFRKNDISSDKDLKDFIISAYKYRNNVAHPEKINDLDYIPNFLYKDVQNGLKKLSLERYIIEYFSMFILFILKVWIKQKCENNNDWYEYLDSLY